jgi:hypothetical protein
MRMLLLVCLVQLACACTPHEVRCDGRLERINAAATSRGATSGAGANSASGVP